MFSVILFRDFSGNNHSVCTATGFLYAEHTQIHAEHVAELNRNRSTSTSEYTQRREQQRIYGWTWAWAKRTESAILIYCNVLYISVLTRKLYNFNSPLLFCSVLFCVLFSRFAAIRPVLTLAHMRVSIPLLRPRFCVLLRFLLFRLDKWMLCWLFLCEPVEN